jgi:type IV pilus assembly protein PilW
MNANHKRTACALRRQRGFTIVELSVATLIGLFLLGGLLSITQDMRRTFTNQNQMAQMQDSERLAMTLITDVIQEAGYYPDPVSETIKVAFLAGGVFAQNGQALYGTHNAAAPGDTIFTLFKTAANDGVINCRGGSNTSGGFIVYTNEFSVVNTAANPESLMCTVYINGAAQPAVALVTGVLNLQVLYGVKTSFAIANDNADTYLTATQVQANPQYWQDIICVKVTLTFDNSKLAASQPGQPATIPFTRVITVMSNGGVNTI